MRITVRLFARLRDVVGAPELTHEAPDGATLRSTWQALCERHPGLERYTSSISGAINEEYARLDARVKDGDEVAFLPPVSGGHVR